MERLIRLYEEFGQSPWLDNLQARLPHDRPAGRAARPRHPRPHVATRRSSRRRSRARPTTTSSSATLAADDQPDHRRLLGAGARTTSTARSTCFAPAVRRERRRATASSASRSPPAWPTTPTAPTAAARDLHERIDRPNLMVKIPAPPRACRADPADDRRGPQHQRHVDLQPRPLPRGDGGLPRRARGVRRQPAPTCRTVASVASFFISRVDTEVDRRLEAIGTPEALALRGKAAVAQGKLAYQLFRETFGGPRWEALAARGARVQRPLWASHVDQEPGLPRHAVRRQADRPGHRQHDARRHDRGVRRPRHARPHRRRRRRRGRGGVGRARRGRRRHGRRRRRSSSARACRSFQKSFDELLDALEAKAAELAGG